jgi:cytochrome c553
MSTITKRWIFVLSAFLFVMLLAIVSVPVSVSAAQEAGAISNSCFTCHEDLYYLHDTGKYYCITEHKDRCINCHEGNANVLNKDESHFGLLAHPQKNDGAKCQQCHAADAQERLATFASLGGYKTVIEVETYVPSTDVKSGFPEGPEENQLVENWPWLAGSIALFGLWLALVFLSPQKP